MDDKTRIYYVRTSPQVNLSQEAFGARINIKSRGHISSLENGSRELTSRIVSDVCREFNVNEEWLLTGKGDMFNHLSRDEETAAIVAKILSEDDEERPLKADFLNFAAKIIDDNNCYDAIESRLLELAELVRKKRTE